MRRHGSLVSQIAAVSLLLVAAASPDGARAQSEGEHFGLTDHDKSGHVDRREYEKRMIEVFYFADRDKDGFVTIEELEVVETVDHKAFGAADGSGEGKLTIEEFVAYRMVDFDTADKNKDGVLTYEEVQTWTASHR